MRLYAAFLLTTGLFAQNPVSDVIRSNYGGLKRNMLEAAEKVAEKDYGWRPTPEVMSFTEIVVHVASSNFGDCSVLKGEANPYQAKKLEAKAEVVALVKSSYDYCDPAIAGLNDAMLPETVQRGTRSVVKASSGVHLLAHPNLHYGNLITYMRLRGIVPPETERAQQAAKKGTR